MCNLSFIIVNWNAKEYLLQCLDSLACEAGRHRAEIIVVDNGSCDGSPEAVASEFPQARLLRNHANLGFAKANNIGMEQSAGDFLFLVNSDVKVLPGCIDRMVGYMARNPAVGMLGPMILNPNLTWQPSCRKFPSLGNMLGRAFGLDNVFPRISRYPPGRIRCVEVLSGCFLMLRKEALPRVGLLDESFFMYAEDIDWCKRFWQAGWEVVYYPAARAIHYGGASSARAPVRFYLEMLHANLLFWKKHHSPLAQIGFRCLSLLYHALRILQGVVLYPFMPAAQPALKLKVKRSMACVSRLLCPPAEEIQLRTE
jgi:GT2 family glycosyltransferase